MPRQSLKDAFNDWLESFSLSQLKNIPRTKNIYWQLFWFLTFLTTLGAGLWKSYGEVQKYLDYPFDTYKRFEPSLSTPFPAVTICNLNPMSQENGNYIRQVKELMTVYRYHLSLIAEKEAKDATTNDEKANENNGKRVKRSSYYDIVTLTPLEVGQGSCYATTFETTSSTTTTPTTTTELPTTTTKTTTEQYTIAPSTTTAEKTTTTEIPVQTTTVHQTTTTSEIPVLTTTIHQTTTNAPTSTEETEPTSTITEATVPKTTVLPTTTYAPTTDVPSSTPLSTAPQKTKPGTTVTQESETEIPTSETAKTQTEELLTVQTTVKYTETSSENPTSAVTTTSKSGRTTGKSTKSSASTEYPTTEPYSSEIPSTSSTPPSTVKHSMTEKKETAASTTANIGDSNDQTKKAADVEVQTTKPSMIKVQTTTSQSNVFSTTKPENIEIPTTERPTVKPTKKSTNTDFGTLKTKSTESALRGSSTLQPTTKSVNNEIVTNDPENSESTTLSIADSNDRTTKSTAHKHMTTKSVKLETTASRPTTLNQNEIKNQTTTFTPHITSQEQNANYSPSSSKDSSVSHSSSSTKPSDNSATSTTKTMTNTQESTSLPATLLTSESTKFTSKSTTFSATQTIFDDSEKRTTKSEADKDETTKLEATVPTSTSTPKPQRITSTPQITIQEQDDKYLPSTIKMSVSSTTTITNQLPGQTTQYKSSATASSGNSATSTTTKTSTFSATTAITKSTKTASESTVFSSATTTTSSKSSIQEPHRTMDNLEETSTTTVSTNSVQNEDSETQKSSKSTTANDKATSETNNQHSSPSTTPSPNAQLTTADPVIFEGLTKSEMDKLTEKFQIVPDSSRISLESQAQGRLLSISNSNLSSGYAVNDIIISCTYNMKSCDLEKDFSKMTDPWFGNCYTFNYDAKHLIVGAGNKFGLKIVAFSNVTEYLSTTSAAGIKVVVHKQNFDPFPNNEGIYASVGSHVDVNVRYKSLEQLTAPYGVCRHENDTAGYIYDGRYRIEGCYRSCFQQQIIDDCQCADPRFPKPRGSNITFCDVSNVTGFTCYVRYLSTKGDFMHVKNCVCPHGCTEPDYTLDVWPSKWPIKKNNFTTPKCWGNYSNTKIDCLKAYKDNAVSIDVTHKYMFYRRTYEQASFSVMDLILEIAGNLGLWTGFSMLVLGEIFHIFFFLFSRPNVDARVEDIEMSDMSNQNTTDIYDSQNIADEYENDVPRPFISHALNAGGLIQGVPSANDNVSSESESEEEDFDLIEPDSYAAFLVKPELLYDISKEFGDDVTDGDASEVQPKSLQGSKLVDRVYLELKKAGKIQPMCPVNFKKYHFVVPSNYKSDASSTSLASGSWITQNEAETEGHKDPDVHHEKSIKPLLVKHIFPAIENLEMTGLPQSRCPFPAIKGFVRTLADVPDDYRPYISNGRLCYPNTRKYYFPNESQTDASQSTSTKNATLSDDETQSPSSSYKNT